MFLDAFRIQRIWLFIMFLDTFHNQKCLETVKRQNPLKYSKNLVTSPVSGHLPYSKVFLDTYRIQKCPERVKRQNPLKYSKNLVNSPVSRHCLLGKVGRLEGLKVGILEGWKIRRLEGSSNEGVLSFPKVIIPDRAERRRREARRV